MLDKAHGDGAREAVQRSEARLAAILAIAADAIISVDEAQRITLFNQGAERMFGYRREEILGQPLSVLLPERFRAAHGEHVRGFAASGVVARRMGERSEIAGRRKSGEEFPAEASISMLNFDGERIFTVVLRDITDRKRAHEALAQSNAELERRVSERTVELYAEIERREQAQAQLVRSQRMEAFGQLTGGIAHDFNNLLTVVIGNLELLEMRLKDEKDRTIVGRAKDAAEMGARLTGRLLMFARRRQLETAPVDLNAQVAGMADLLQRTLGEQIELDTVLEPALWTARVDTSEIENAVLNLAINARDAMPRGGKLRIETANVSCEDEAGEPARPLAPGDYVRLSVSDTGTGMSPEVKQKAFEPFFTTKQPGKGTGLGLSTIYGFVHQLGGAVDLSSELGRGTTVNIYLPRSEPSGEAGLSARGGAPLPRGEGTCVLLVEDNPDVRLITRNRLERLGYSVIEAESGPAAIAAMASAPSIEVVFSDVIMAGGMSGFEVARWVAVHAPEKRVLLTSGSPDQVLQTQDGAATDIRILRKPYSLRDLAHSLRSATTFSPAEPARQGEPRPL